MKKLSWILFIQSIYKICKYIRQIMFAEFEFHQLNHHKGIIIYIKLYITIQY